MKQKKIWFCAIIFLVVCIVVLGLWGYQKITAKQVVADDASADSMEVAETATKADKVTESYIEIFTAFEKIPNMDAYSVEEEIHTYSGKIHNVANVKALHYEVKDLMENVVQSGEILFDKEEGGWSIENFGLVVGWNDMYFQIQLMDGTEIVEKISYLNANEENFKKTDIDLSDTDGDGIQNYYESILGTEPDSEDADGDSLSDYIELMCTGTDPNLYDTDGDGIWDADEDEDGDGLTNAEEVAYGASPFYSDSDFDGVDDRTEVLELGTNPLWEDTDDDDLIDGIEWKVGTDPNLSDTDGDGILDGEEMFRHTISLAMEEDTDALKEVSVSLVCSGTIYYDRLIKYRTDVDELLVGVKGRIGLPVQIFFIAPYEEVIITFHYDKNRLGEIKEENLKILWYDDVNREYVLMEDSIVDMEKQTVSCATTNYATCLLVDEEVWLDEQNPAEREETVQEEQETKGENTGGPFVILPGQ